MEATLLEADWEQHLKRQLTRLPREQQREVLHFAEFLAEKRQRELEAGYLAMREDAANEAEATEWTEGLIGDVADEAEDA